MKYTEIQGDLISLAKRGEFDVITHGCNCFCRMGSGIAPLMAAAFGCDTFPMENPKTHEGMHNKLGAIDFQTRMITTSGSVLTIAEGSKHCDMTDHPLHVVNSYTQYHYGHKYGAPLDYDALALCLKKINFQFKGAHIGLPKIGCGLAGGDWSIVKEMILTYLKNMDVTVVIFK
jgi:O-acetyl-ADP-ribose deacetylase (regulator of RNase III)